MILCAERSTVAVLPDPKGTSCYRDLLSKKEGHCYLILGDELLQGSYELGGGAVLPDPKGMSCYSDLMSREDGLSYLILRG